MAIRLAVLLSGSGTTLQNILDHIQRRQLDAEVVVVISSRKDAFGLERAQNANVPGLAVARNEFGSTESFSTAVWEAIRRYDADLVVLAGFMSLITVPSDYTNRIINVHPALIPAFCGKGMYGHHVHEAVIAYGAKVSGATVHFVNEQYDNGPIILQGVVSVEENDTSETLAGRVQALERDLYPKAIQLYAEGRLKVEGRRVRILPDPVL